MVAGRQGSAPDIDARGMDVPSIDGPDIDGPDIDGPGMDATRMDALQMDALQMDALQMDAMADAISEANRFLVQLSVRALDRLAPDLNLTEFRTLVLLFQRGSQRLIDIATALDVTSTTATRLADRLVEHGMVERHRTSSDRREVHLALAAPGRGLVQAVSRQRRRFVVSVLEPCSAADQVIALEVLSRLAGKTCPAERQSA